MKTKEEVKHTPTPWHRMGLSIMDESNAKKQASGANYGVDCIAFVQRVNGDKNKTQWHDEQAQANAEFIVRAVNHLDGCREQDWRDAFNRKANQFQALFEVLLQVKEYIRIDQRPRLVLDPTTMNKIVDEAIAQAEEVRP